MNWYLGPIKKYAEFSGRASRQEYWLYLLFNGLVAFGILLIGQLIRPGLGWTLYYVYSVAVLLPSTAVYVRRLHDTDHSAWWIFITLIPLIGAIWTLILLASPSNYGPNSYGPNPTEADSN